MEDESCICVFAFPCKNIKNENRDQLLFDFRVSTTIQSFDSPLNPTIKNSLPRKTFEYSRKDFLSIPNPDQCDLIRNKFQHLDIGSSMENIYWGTKNPEEDDDKTILKLESLDEAVKRVLKVARNCLKRKGRLIIFVKKFDKLSLEAFKKRARSEIRYEKQPLDDWILENMYDEKYKQLQPFIYEKLYIKSPENNLFFGLRSSMVSTNIDKDCSICLMKFMKGTQAIKMPCSHAFHGFCIFTWLEVNPSCPFCRFQLFPKEDDEY